MKNGRCETLTKYDEERTLLNHDFSYIRSKCIIIGFTTETYKKILTN